MTIVDGIYSLAEWLEREICQHHNLKVPSDKQTANYSYKLANPSVHVMFAPPSNMAGLKSEICPGIVVSLTGGTDKPTSPREFNFELLIGTWDPGTHAPDVMRGEPESAFSANADGWRDAWNLADSIIREMRNAGVINGDLRLKSEDGIKFSPYKQDGAIIDFYPYYYTTLEFTCTQGAPPPTSYEQFI